MGAENDSEDDLADLEPTDSRFLELVDEKVEEQLAKKGDVRFQDKIGDEDDNGDS